MNLGNITVELSVVGFLDQRHSPAKIPMFTPDGILHKVNTNVVEKAHCL